MVMTATMIQGSRDTLNITQEKRVIDMREIIAELDPVATPFLTFMKKAKSNIRVATQPKFEWLEDKLGERWDAVDDATDMVAGDTAMVVDHAIYFRVGDLVKIPRTGEVVRVDAVVLGTNTLTITRSVGATAAAGILNNDPIVIIGNSNPEGGGSRLILSTKEQPKFNYTQIIKTPFGVTNTQRVSKTYGGQDMNYQHKKAGIEHAMDIARAALFGERSEVTNAVNGKPERTMDGLLAQLTSNNYDASGVCTQAEFNTNIAEKLFAKGSKEKLGLCSGKFISAVNDWANVKLQVVQGADTFGLAIMTLTTPFGKLHLTHEQLFEGAVWGGTSVFLDVDNIYYVPLKDRDTSLKTNIQANDADERKDEYLTECGLEVHLPDTHAVLTGVTAGA